MNDNPEPTNDHRPNPLEKLTLAGCLLSLVRRWLLFLVLLFRRQLSCEAFPACFRPNACLSGVLLFLSYRRVGP
jgi:hypothetical protein